MRRGVSLEVIVEEDDNAEVTHDPLPPLDDDDEEEEEEEMDDDDDDSENGGPSSTTATAGGGGRGGGGDGNGAAGGGGGGGGASGIEERRRKRERRRTLALTRLRSVSCETLTLLDTSDMDSCCSEWDDDDDLSSSSNRNYVTINRPISRRRILESSQCDSEDSGIEYQSNEDETSPGDQSGGEERKEDDQLADDIHDQETATESDDEDVESRPAIGGGRSDVILNSQSEHESTFPKEEMKVEDKEESGGGCIVEMSPREALENDNVVIVEKTPPTPPPLPPTPSKKTKNENEIEGDEDEEDELRQKRAAYTIRNKEVQLEELPAPHTVRSVRQLFEDNRTPLGHIRAWRDLGRFRDIKSNPSSKILRFDRGDSGEGPSNTRFPRLGSSFTLPRLPSQRPNPPTPSCTIPRHLKTSPSTARPQNTHPPAKTQREVAATEGGQVVSLRKPTVRGFNVKKALQEDPRTFHAQTLPSSSSSKVSTAHHARKSHSVKGRALHKNEVGHDRSDTESLSSDISEDSGVSNDSTIVSSSSSTSSSKSLGSLNTYSSDPSFKWIDPAVMAKIRSVGTTVIFFGPRQRASQSKSSCGLLNRPLPKHLLKTKLQPPAAPRIVGVLRKKSPTPTLSEQDVEGAEDGSGAPGKWKKGQDTTVVYNFTRHKATPWV